MNLFGAKQHDPDVCQCLVGGPALAIVRKAHKLSFEAIASGSGYSAEYLKGVERGDEGKCGDLKVSDAYERVMGTPMETALAILNVDLAQTALQVNRMIHRLSNARNAETETKAEEQPPGTDAGHPTNVAGPTGTADGEPSVGVTDANQAPARKDGHAG